MGEFQKYVGVEKPTLPPVLPKKFTFQKSLRGKHDHEKFAFIKVYLYIKKSVVRVSKIVVSRCFWWELSLKILMP